jgi:hypothetical protein
MVSSRQPEVVAMSVEVLAGPVSKLLVVLYSEQATQQVVNTGPRYQ